MSTTTPTASAEDVISESWSSWTDKPLTESKLHNKLSSRSRKSVEDILEAAKRRQDRAEQNLASQRSARKQQLESERAREVEVRKRHDDGIEAIAAESARKLAHAEEVRLAKQKQQAERLKAHEEHAEAVRQRKMAQPPVAEGEAGHDDAQRDTERGAPSASHPARGGGGWKPRHRPPLDHVRGEVGWRRRREQLRGQRRAQGQPPAREALLPVTQVRGGGDAAQPAPDGGGGGGQGG